MNNDNAWENVVVESNISNFIKIRQNFGKQGEVAELLGLSSQVLLSRIENGSSGIDNRTYSLFLLLTGNHPNYMLTSQDDFESIDMRKLVQEVPEDNGESIKALRKSIVKSKTGKPITQGRFANLLGLTGKGAISCFENGKTKPTKQNYTLMLLIADKHPYFFLVARNEVGGLFASEDMTDILSPTSIELKIIPQQNKILVITNKTNAKQINTFLSKNGGIGYISVDSTKFHFKNFNMWASLPAEFENEYKSSFYIFTFEL